MRSDFPAPDELWERQRKGLGLTNDEAAQKVKDAAYETGKAVKNAGETIKEKGE